MNQKKKLNLKIKSADNSKQEDLSTLSIGTQIINIPKSISKQIKINESKYKFSFSLIVTRVWIEKKKDRYYIHLGDLDDISFD